MVRSAFLNTRLDPEVKEAAERAARADGRSLTGLVEFLLRSYCIENGFLPKDRGAHRD
jgi:antitoxin component of RelBE/YafQ-DinJ toxin-antitoxin module